MNRRDYHAYNKHKPPVAIARSRRVGVTACIYEWLPSEEGTEVNERRPYYATIEALYWDKRALRTRPKLRFFREDLEELIRVAVTALKWMVDKKGESFPDYLKQLVELGIVYDQAMTAKVEVVKPRPGEIEYYTECVREAVSARIKALDPECPEERFEGHTAPKEDDDLSDPKKKES